MPAASDLPLSVQQEVLRQLGSGIPAFYETVGRNEWERPLYAFTGTGGLVTVRFLTERRQGYSLPGIELPEPAREVETTEELIDFAAMTALIRDVFGRSMSRLADIFGVSRQTLYNWLAGEVPNQRHQQKLREFAAGAQVFQELGLKLTPPMLSRTVSRGRSFFDLIAEGGDGAEAARKLTEIIRRAERDKTRLIATTGGRKAKPEQSDLGTPALDEKA